NELRTNLHQGLPRIGCRFERRGRVPVGPSRRWFASVGISIHVLRSSRTVMGDDGPRFLSRRYGLTFAHVLRDVLDVLHEPTEARPAERDLAARAVEDSCRQGTLERQHREHSLLDGALCHEIDDLHRPSLAHAVNAPDALL